MAGPGGTEVGRVSVRVVPDLDGFRDKVKRELEEVEGMEAEVKVTLDLTELKAQVEEIKALLKSISDETVKINVDKEGAGLAGLSQGLKNVAGDAEKVGKKLKDSLGKDSDGLEGRVSRISRLLEGFGNFMQKVGAQAQDLATKLGGELTSGARSFGSSLTALITQLALWGPLLIGAASALLYLVGIVAAAAAALPAALFAIGAPIAAIILGMDGLKNAFKELGPEFDKMKSRLSDTFEKGFKPVVQGLKPLLPILSDGLNSTAEALGRFGNKFTDMINSTFRAGGGATNLENFKNALKGVPEFLDEFSNGAVKFTESIIRAAGQTGALKILGQTLSDVFTKLSGFFDQSIIDGSFMKGLENLRSTLSSITGMFTALLRNALKFFNGAAPGMNKFFDSLSSFFLSIDWERLGKAFGTVFERLGDAIDKIPPETIDSITTSFENLADAFGDILDGKSFDVLISTFQLAIDVITGVAHAFDGLLETIAHVGDFIAGIPDWFGDMFDKGGEITGGLLSGAKEKWNEFWTWITGLKDKVLTGIGDGLSWLLQKGRDIVQGLINGVNEKILLVRTKFQQIKDTVIAFFTGAVNWLLDKGRDIVMGVVNGIGQGILFIRMKVQEIKNTVIAAFLGAGSWLVSAGRNIIDGLISGIRSAFGAVQRTLGFLTSLLPSWKGPASVDKKLLFGNGQLIMQSLVDGLNSGFGDVKDTLGSMTTDIGSAFTSPTLQGSITATGADIAAVGTSQLAVAGQVDSNLDDAVTAALSGWSFVIDETGIARLVNKGQQKLGRRG